MGVLGFTAGRAELRLPQGVVTAESGRRGFDPLTPHPALTGEPRRRKDREMSETREMTVREAGRLGGAKRRDELGHEGYQALGKKGGAATKERHGSAFYSEIGKKGGETVRRERGPDFFQKIGRKGGARVRELIEKGKGSE